ncbi:MAG: hypothetical protein ACK5IB_08490 [Qingshengfaniella sp.]
MTQDADKTGRRQKPPPKTREDRLKAALKANLQKRKAQARTRAGNGTDTPPADSGTDKD